jgi:pyruvate/2-oxoglutarate dehydrogenase complex dihydrolipoamide dehydrogenase (E3) component
VDIEGKEHVTAVTIAAVDSHNKPIPGTEERYTCDTLLLSCGLIPENELSNKAGIKMNPVTSGPIVNESLETNIPGVFACGNVLHVHDLVDYVSEEAAKAGSNAAKFVQNGGKDEAAGHVVEVKATEGARYTVPCTIDVNKMEDLLTVRFRVGAVFKESYVSVYFDDERVMHNKKRILAPGEMEQVILQKKKLLEKPDLKTITVKIEAE